MENSHHGSCDLIRLKKGSGTVYCTCDTAQHAAAKEADKERDRVLDAAANKWANEWKQHAEGKHTIYPDFIKNFNFKRAFDEFRAELLLDLYKHHSTFV